MTRLIQDAELEIYNPDNSGTTPDATIPNSDLRFARVSARIQHSRDQGRFRIDNDDASWSSTLDPGDRVTFRTRLEGEASLSDRWTGLVRDMNFEIEGPVENTLSLVCDDFVFGVFSIRYATYRFENTQISGTSDAIVDTLVADNCPEVGTGQIATVSTTTDAVYRRQNILEAFVDLIKKDEILMASDGMDFVFQSRGDPNAKWTLGSADRHGKWSTALTDEELVNDVVVDGGNDTALDIKQTSADSFQTVTESSRATQVITVRKSDVARVELDIQPTGSGEAVIVRLQKNDGSGSPVDATKRSSDLARTRLDSGELIDGFNPFRFEPNDVPDPNPVVIVETDGGTGQDVAFDSGTGDLAYKVYYRFPVIASATDKNSIDEYRRHEGRYRRESITSLEEAEQIAPRLVGRNRDPQTTVTFDAQSDRAFALSTAEVLDVDEPDARANGEFVVGELRDEYRSGQQNRLKRTVTLHERTTV